MHLRSPKSAALTGAWGKGSRSRSSTAVPIAALSVATRLPRLPAPFSAARYNHRIGPPLASAMSHGQCTSTSDSAQRQQSVPQVLNLAPSTAIYHISCSYRFPSRAGSSAGSGGSSWHSPAPSSRASSPVSFASEFPSRPASSMSMDDWDQEFPESLSALPLHPDESLPEIPSRVRAFSEVERPSSPALSVASSVQYRKSRHKGKGRADADSSQIKITRQLFVDEIMDTTVQSTWTVPCTPTAYRVDISAFEAQLAVWWRTELRDKFQSRFGNCNYSLRFQPSIPQTWN
ncbi:hypothetical protein B0H10DRAFT_2329584 [Mycena sp. CBHHK59/15]|nr:hypothetical protein B0H10DRAFT_1969621 [Mycena sp. CBHHK59/15]KAJ6591923.1 hypothetical protein B0H10DRAFT_2329584 [Mycena sp. CBHHK59/15]